jgi:hypothetical protein
VVKPFIPLKEVTFLKRSFKFRAEFNHYVAPLDEESIKRSLCVWTWSKVTVEEQMSGNLISNFQELLYHGPEKYNFYRDIIVIEVYDKKLYYNEHHIWLQPWLDYIPTFDEMLDRWKKKYLPEEETGVSSRD